MLYYGLGQIENSILLLECNLS